MVKDKLGNEITIGSYINYTNLGTIGKVLDTKTDEKGSWVLISVDELTKLWYNTEYVEVTSEKRDVTFKDEEDKELSVEEIANEVGKRFSSEMQGDAGGGG